MAKICHFITMYNNNCQIYELLIDYPVTIICSRNDIA